MDQQSMQGVIINTDRRFVLQTNRRPEKLLVSKVKNLPTIIKCLVTAKEYTDPSE